MTTKQSPGVESGALEAVACASQILADPVTGGAEARPRCIPCSRVLTSPRSVARGYGPVCWKRAVKVQLDMRRDAVGRALAALARRVRSLDAQALAVVAAALAGLDGVSADAVR